MEPKLSIGVILASVREGRRGEAFAHWIHAKLVERPELEVELFDLKEWALPVYALREQPGIAEKSYAEGTLERRWAEKVKSCDGFVFVTPEYNHAYPGSLKNALDQVYAPWNYKPAAFVSYGGFSAGARAVEQLRLVVSELRMVPVRDEVNVRLIGFTGDERGWPSDGLNAKKAEALVNDLVWWARVTKEGRAQHPR